jgi:hypothetical protein
MSVVINSIVGAVKYKYMAILSFSRPAGQPAGTHPGRVLSSSESSSASPALLYAPSHHPIVILRIIAAYLVPL